MTDIGQPQVGRTDLDARAELIAHAAVKAWCPTAVLDTMLTHRVLPVFPEPLSIKTRIKVSPREHLSMVALTGGVPVKVDRLIRQCCVHCHRPPVKVEVLTPAIEAGSVPPRLQDHSANSAIAPGE